MPSPAIVPCSRSRHPAAAQDIPLPINRARWCTNFSVKTRAGCFSACALFDRGSARHIEDIAMARHPFYGVADGATGIHLPDSPIIGRSGATWGREAALELRRALRAAKSTASLPDIAGAANRRLDRLRTARGCEEPALVGGATGALVRFGDRWAYWAQWGDAFVLFRLKDGTVFATVNQLARHDCEMYAEIGRLMDKGREELFGERSNLTEVELSRVRSEYMWPHFVPFLRTQRNARINSTEDPAGYGLLNGDRDFSAYIHSGSIDLSRLDVLLLATDGFLKIERERGEIVQPGVLLDTIKQRGLAAHLSELRADEQRKAASTHITFQEATAMVFTAQ